MPLAASCGEPPPSDTTQSAPSFCSAARPALTLATVGLGLTSSNTALSMPACLSRAVRRSAKPSLTSGASVTIKALVKPMPAICVTAISSAPAPIRLLEGMKNWATDIVKFLCESCLGSGTEAWEKPRRTPAPVTPRQRQGRRHGSTGARGAAPSLGGFRGISVTASAIHRAACTICTHAAPDSIRWPADRRPRGSPPSGQAGPFRAAHAAAVPSSRPGLAGPFRPLARGTAGCRR